MGAVTNTNCYLNVKLNQVRKWIIETQILAARERVCRGGSVAAQVEQLFPKWDLGTPPEGVLEGVHKKIRNCLEGNSLHWEIFTLGVTCWEVYCNECALFSVSEASANGNVRMTHTSSVVRVSERICSMPRMQTERGITSFVAQGIRLLNKLWSNGLNLALNEFVIMPLFDLLRWCFLCSCLTLCCVLLFVVFFLMLLCKLKSLRHNKDLIHAFKTKSTIILIKCLFI